MQGMLCRRGMLGHPCSTIRLPGLQPAALCRHVAPRRAIPRMSIMGTASGQESQGKQTRKKPSKLSADAGSGGPSDKETDDPGKAGVESGGAGTAESKPAAAKKTRKRPPKKAGEVPRHSAQDKTVVGPLAHTREEPVKPVPPGLPSGPPMKVHKEIGEALEVLLRWAPQRLAMYESAVVPVAELFANYCADSLTAKLPKLSWHIFEAAFDRMVKESGTEGVVMLDTPQAGRVVTGIYLETMAAPARVTQALRQLPHTPEGRKWLPKEARPPRGDLRVDAPALMGDAWAEPEPAWAGGHYVWVLGHATRTPSPSPSRPASAGPEPHRINGSAGTGTLNGRAPEGSHMDAATHSPAAPEATVPKEDAAAAAAQEASHAASEQMHSPDHEEGSSGEAGVQAAEADVNGEAGHMGVTGDILEPAVGGSGRETAMAVSSLGSGRRQAADEKLPGADPPGVSKQAMQAAHPRPTPLLRADAPPQGGGIDGGIPAVEVAIKRWFRQRCRLEWDQMSCTRELYEDFRILYGGKRDYSGPRITIAEFVRKLEALVKTAPNPLARPFKCTARTLSPATNGDRTMWVGVALEGGTVTDVRTLVPLVTEVEVSRTRPDAVGTRLINAAADLVVDYDEGVHLASWVAVRGLDVSLAAVGTLMQWGPIYNAFVTDCVVFMRLSPIGRKDFNKYFKSIQNGVVPRTMRQATGPGEGLQPLPPSFTLADGEEDEDEKKDKVIDIITGLPMDPCIL